MVVQNISDTARWVAFYRAMETERPDAIFSDRFARRLGNAPFKFAPPEGTEFFRKFGWHEAEYRAAMEEAQRLNREMKMMPFWRFMMRFYPKKTREEFRRMSGFVLLERNQRP